MFGNNQMSCMRGKAPDVAPHVIENEASFRKFLPSIIINHEGEYALMRDGNIIRYYPHHFVAESKGLKFYPDGRFCVKKVTEL